MCMGLKRIWKRSSSLSVLMLRRCVCVAVCCSMLQCVLHVCVGFKEDMEKIVKSVCAYAAQVCMCCSMLQCVAVCCSVLQCVACMWWV